MSYISRDKGILVQRLANHNPSRPNPKSSPLPVFLNKGFYWNLVLPNHLPVSVATSTLPRFHSTLKRHSTLLSGFATETIWFMKENIGIGIHLYKYLFIWFFIEKLCQLMLWSSALSNQCWTPATKFILFAGIKALTLAIVAMRLVGWWVRQEETTE